MGFDRLNHHFHGHFPLFPLAQPPFLPGTVVLEVVLLRVSDVVEIVVLHDVVLVVEVLLLTVTEDVVCVEEVHVTEEDVELVAVTEVVVG